MEVQSLIPLIAAIVYIALLAVIALNRPWGREQRYLMLYLVAVAVWEVSESLLLNRTPPEQKIYFFRAVICSSTWWAVQLYLFVRAFLRLPPGLGMWIGYASLFALSLLAVLGYAPPDVIIENGVFTGPVNGWWNWVYVVPLVIIAAMGGITLLKRMRIEHDPAEKNKLSYLTLAVALLVAFGFIGLSPIALIGGIPFSHFGGLLTAFVLAYAITKHGLVSLNSVLRRILGWSLLFTVGICSYALILFMFHVIFGFTLPYQTLIFATLAAIMIAILTYLLRPTFVTIVDYFFYRETYTYRQTLLRFDTEMGTILSLDELAHSMLSVIVKALKIPGAILLFQNVGTGDYVTRYTYPEQNAGMKGDLVFIRDNPIVKYLDKENDTLNVHQIGSVVQFGGLWQIERDMLNNSGLGLLCPIKSRGKLVGILALESKKSEKSFSQEDIEMIKAMAGKAGIVVDNARMFNVLQQQQNQVQHLLSEAIHAQESERQRISVDLHDSVAQWLAGASYQAQTVEAMLPDQEDEKVKEQIHLVEDTIERSLKELRRVVVDLRPPALDELGLSHALRQSLSTLISEGLSCEFKEEGTLVRLPPEVEITVYRVVQEALTNIRKHAGASRVDLGIECKEENVIVKIQDNGKGFNLTTTLENAIAVGSIGLLGMRQRLEMLGGTIEIRTWEGGGTTIIMNLPIPAEEEGVQDGQD